MLGNWNYNLVILMFKCFVKTGGENTENWLSSEWFKISYWQT